MQRIISTESLPVPDQAEYWRQLLSTSLVNVRLEQRPRAGFFGTLKMGTLGSMTLAEIEADSHAVAHSRSRGENFFFLRLQLSGRTTYAQGSRETEVCAGDVVLLDGARPFSMRFPERFRTFTVRIPDHCVRAKLSSPDKVTALSLVRGGRTGTVLSSYMRSLSGLSELESTTADLLTTNLCDLLAIVADDAVPAERLGRDGLRQGILSYIGCNLANPQLRPVLVAERFGISVRMLHKIFSESERSFNRTILEQRLDRCRQAILTHKAEPISGIAYRWGFNDLSYFNRSFRHRFGMTPSQTRAIAM